MLMDSVTCAAFLLRCRLLRWSYPISYSLLHLPLLLSLFLLIRE
jgi:hypothetical protein